MIADFGSMQFYFDRLMALLCGLLGLALGIAAVMLARWRERYALQMASMSLACCCVAFALGMPNAGLDKDDWLELPRRLGYPWWFLGCVAPGFLLACVALGMRSRFQMTKPPNQPLPPARR